MNKTISRNKVIEAVSTEPLFRGQWAARGYADSTGKTCPVCAVGAVLRKAGAPDAEEIRRIAAQRVADRGQYLALKHENAESMIREELKASRYLNALSIYFEKQASLTFSSPDDHGLLSGESLTKVRSKLKRFILKHFPARVSLE